MIPVILSGGSGSRLWPLSRKQFPKQFLALTGEHTLFQQTLERLVFEGMDSPIVVCNKDHKFIVQSNWPHSTCRPRASSWSPSVATPRLRWPSPR